MLNIVGEHASYHIKPDAPLTVGRCQFKHGLVTPGPYLVELVM